MKALDCCGFETSLVLPFTMAWNAGHLVHHWVTFPDSDATTIANLVTEVRRDCCRWGVKPCTYHDGFMDAVEQAVRVLAGKEDQGD